MLSNNKSIINGRDGFRKNQKKISGTHCAFAGWSPRPCIATQFDDAIKTKKFQLAFHAEEPLIYLGALEPQPLELG